MCVSDRLKRYQFSFRPYFLFVTLPSLLGLVTLSCSSEEEGIPTPDVSQIPSETTLLRFDQVLTDFDTLRGLDQLTAAEAQFGSFPDIYFQYIVPVRRGDIDPALYDDIFRAYLRYPLKQRVDSLVTARFGEGEMEVLREDVEQMLRYWKYYLPAAPTPDTLVTFTSQFELAALLYGAGNVAVGLDFALGPDFDYAAVNPTEPIFAGYLTDSYTPEQLVVKVANVLIDDYLPRPRSGRMIDYMVYEGKKMFLLERLLPDMPAHRRFGHRPGDWEWLTENETQIYTYLQAQSLLYDTDARRIHKYTQPAPTTQGMPAESPGQAVNFLGYRIVKSFVDANPDITVPELMTLTDGQQLLTQARYKPR